MLFVESAAAADQEELTTMEEFWRVAALVLFATTLTGVLIAGVAHYAVTTGSPRGKRSGPSRPQADRKARTG